MAWQDRPASVDLIDMESVLAHGTRAAVKAIGGATSAQRAVAGAVGVFDHVHRGLLGTGATRVDPGVERNEVGLLVRTEAFVIGDQPAGPRLTLVAAAHQLVLVLRVLGVRIDVGLLLREELFQRLPGPLLGGCRTEVVGTGPSVG